jgi:YidC/Oxa1 family membrane protein insertase
LNVLEPLYDLVSWVVVTLHAGLTAIGVNPDGGLAWGLSIVGLVIIIRIALIPLFVKQIKSMRNMQVLQPRIREIQKKYKNDRERQSQELMKLYKETGTNPLSSCLPILAQAPFFFALFKVLDGIARNKAYGVLTPELVDSAAEAKIFGAPIASKFVGAESLTVQIVTVIMILLMSASQFITQRQLMVKNLPKDAAENNPFVQQQKVLLYVFPILFAVFGINFPVGVLLYWLVSNLWSMGQQLYVIRRMPSPGSLAHEALEARRRKKAAKRSGLAESTGGAATTATTPAIAADPGNDGTGAKSETKRPAGTGGSSATGPAKGSAKGSAQGSAQGSAKGTDGRPTQSTQVRRQPQRVPRSKRSGAKKKS